MLRPDSLAPDEPSGGEQAGGHADDRPRQAERLLTRVRERCRLGSRLGSGQHRAEALLPEIAAIVEKASGFHGWLWRLRLAEAQAELALARGAWEEAVHCAESSIEQSRARGRVKYHILGLDTRAKALLELQRAREAIAGLREALSMARVLSDPAVFLRPATTLLALDGDDELLRETRATIQRIVAALPNQEMRRLFEAAEPVQRITSLTC